jgi:hypothetical protein
MILLVIMQFLQIMWSEGGQILHDNIRLSISVGAGLPDMDFIPMVLGAIFSREFRFDI